MSTYDDLKIKALEDFPESALIALATSYKDDVSVRTMSCIKIDGDLYFQTDIHSVKAQQLTVQEKAGIAYQNYEIAGTCRLIGHPLDKNNAFFLDIFKKYFPEAAKKYSALKQEALYRFVPTDIKIWNYVGSNAQIEHYDLANNEYFKEELDY